MEWQRCAAVQRITLQSHTHLYTRTLVYTYTFWKATRACRLDFVLKEAMRILIGGSVRHRIKMSGKIFEKQGTTVDVPRPLNA